MKAILTGAIAGVILSVGAASAATLSLVGGDSLANLPSNFGVLRDASGSTFATPVDLVEPLTVYHNSIAPGDGLFVSSAFTGVEVTFTYIGFEASNSNTGSTSMGTVFESGTALNGDTFTYQTAVPASGSLVDLIFESTGAVACGTATNGGPISANCELAFSTISPDGTEVYAMFGDGFGDTDLDDMVIKITVASIPLPAGVLLLGTALGGLGFARRRKATATA